jgi:hypothetical protein
MSITFQVEQDFIIQNPPLTDQERKEISDFIASRKSKKK